MLQRIPLSIRFITIACLLVIAFILALSFGAVHYSFAFLIDGFIHGEHPKQVSTLLELRLPRNIAAVLIGASFGVAGLIMQAVTRNPLADPGLLGVSAGAKVGLAVVMALLPSLHFSGLMLASFLGALGDTICVLWIARSDNLYKVILAGAAISAFLTAIATAINLIAKTSKNVTMWTSGGLMGVTMQEVTLILPILVVTLVICIFFARQVGILTMNEETATSLGINAGRWRRILFFLVAILTGVSVSVIGELAFIGLIIPHFARFIVGMNYRALVPMSALIGALFLVIADTLSRSLTPPFEIPVIAILSIIGLPFFVYIVKGEIK